MSTGSVTHWIARLKMGDDWAAQKIWERYYAKLVDLADSFLRELPRRAADEEDVAQVAFAAFFHAIEQCRYPQLRCREDLWSLLVEITENKATDLWRQELAEKRGGGKVRGDSAFNNGDSNSKFNGIEQLPDNEPTPEFTALLVEQFRQRLEAMSPYDDKRTLRTIALLKLEGYSNLEIVEYIQKSNQRISLRSVERKLKLIREIWSREE